MSGRGEGRLEADRDIALRWADAALERYRADGLDLRVAQLHAVVEVLAFHAGEQSELTDRELEVLRLAAQGCSNAEISRRLFITMATTKTHMGHILQKLGVDSRAKAVALARDRGII